MVRRIGGIAITLAVVLPLVWAIWRLWTRLAPPLDAQMVLAAAIVALVLLAAIWWLWWRLPRRQLHKLDVQIHDPKARADTEDNFRKTVGQALGGAAVLMGAAVAYLQFTQQQQSSHDLLISNQVSKGFEQLASDKITERLGGIYALEGVMNTSDQYHRPVLEALCAFVRDSATRGRVTIIALFEGLFSGPHDNTTGKVNEELAIDIQAALTVIGRRKPGPAAPHLGGGGDVHLDAANIAGAVLHGADLSEASLVGVNLNKAEIGDADLSGANLNRADLSGAWVSGANLNGAFLVRANLANAILSEADLSDASMKEADLRDAQLMGSNLSRADLRGANLSGALLMGVNLGDADLTGANLGGAALARVGPVRGEGDAENLTQEQLDAACGKPKTLPPGLTLDKPCPEKPPVNPSAPAP